MMLHFLLLFLVTFEVNLTKGSGIQFKFQYSFPFVFDNFVSEHVPVFDLLEERSLDGSPSVSITFPDGYSDRLILSRFYINEEAKLTRSEDCNFIGHLEGEPGACVAMTGCPGSNDLEFTIMSEHSAHSTFKWLKNGNVEIVESPFKVLTFIFKFISFC